MTEKVGKVAKGKSGGMKVGRVVLEVEFEERRWRWKRVCGDGA